MTIDWCWFVGEPGAGRAEIGAIVSIIPSFAETSARCYTDTRVNFGTSSGHADGYHVVRDFEWMVGSTAVGKNGFAMMIITPERMQTYRDGARARDARRMQEIENRRARAWAVAIEAANLLKMKYGATQVLVYGSLAHGNWFSSRSDIDIAAAGIAPEEYWRAWSALDQIDRAIEIELVALESAPDSLLQQIIVEGIEL